MSWQRLLEEAVKTEVKCSTFAAFNTNIDIVIKVSPEDLDSILQADPSLLQHAPQDPTQVSPITTPAEFVALLKNCLAGGKSYYDVVDISLADWFTKFPNRRQAMGGQAGIIANQMATLGARSHVYNVVLSKQQAEAYDPRVLFPKITGEGMNWVPVREGVNDTWTKVNFIFEYAKNERFHFGEETVVTPRANRVILGTRNPKAAMRFDPEIEPYLSDVGTSVDVGFMAGYHHGKIIGRTESLDEYINLSLTQKNALQRKNPDLWLHYEYVPMKSEEDEKKLLSSLVPEFSSFGINENEISKVLREFGEERLAAEIKNNERAYVLYEGTAALQRIFEVPRIQLHNLGYYILVLKRPYPVAAEKVRQACLFASSVNGVKAMQGGAVPREAVPAMANHPLSDIGMDQLEQFATEARERGLDIPANFTKTGIWEREDHTVLLVPAHVVPNPVSTVGMGDTVSSSAYAAEVSLKG